MGAGFFDQLVDAELRGPFGVGQQAFHELQIEFFVDEAGAFAVELVAKSARADEGNRFAAVPCCDGFAHGFGHGVDAAGFGQGELHGVDADGHDGNRARTFWPQQFQRQGASVVYQHFLAGDDVEFFVDQMVDDLP